jgi:hypothetical protein
MQPGPNHCPQGERQVPLATFTLLGMTGSEVLTGRADELSTPYQMSPGPLSTVMCLTERLRMFSRHVVALVGGLVLAPLVGYKPTEVPTIGTTLAT